MPWLWFEEEVPEDQREAQRARQEALGPDSVIGERCYIAQSAAVFPDRLRVGDDSYIAAYAYVTGDVTTGTHCTLNPFTTVRGKVALGDGVRIGAHSALLGFNHSFAPDRPVFRQPHTSAGITVGDDVWIGSHVIVVDGVTIGDHCVIGAGAVVTKDLPPWTVAAGNPARPLRDRRDTGPRPTGSTNRPRGADRLTEELARFGRIARAQVEPVLARCWDGENYVDRPGVTPTVRAHCDAVELADLLLDAVPPQLSASEHVRRLAGRQDPDTGLVAEFGARLPEAAWDRCAESGAVLYHVLATGYALDLLGSSFPYPIRGVAEMTAGRLADLLAGLPWQEDPWAAGAWIDAWATAARWNLGRKDGAEGSAMTPGTVEALFGWLSTRVDPWTGAWGSPSAESGRLRIVNGYYRLARGSFVQFGIPVPHPERVVDLVLDHARDPRHFGGGRQNACNVLDVAHPLWLCSRQLGKGYAADGGYRGAEIHRWAESLLTEVLVRWQDRKGFAFESDAGGGEATLMGTEMWCAVIWYLADICGRADALGYRPRGVHRPEPAAWRADGYPTLS